MTDVQQSVLTSIGQTFAALIETLDFAAVHNVRPLHDPQRFLADATMIPKPGAALLFDIDGTLADTDPVHLAAFNQAFAPFGHHMDKARFVRELQGRANEDIAASFLPHLPHDEGMAVMAAKEALFRDIAATDLQAVAGLF